MEVKNVLKSLIVIGLILTAVFYLLSGDGGFDSKGSGPLKSDFKGTSLPNVANLPSKSKAPPPRNKIQKIKIMPELPINPGDRPIGNKIEFRVVEGYAVAYGDILLGKLEEPLPGDRGVYDAPQPQTWEQAEIAYSISADLPHPERIEKALTYLRQKTPINFVPFSGQRDAILFEPAAEHCLSLLGKVGGVQPIKLAPGCQWQEVLHEILHSLGFVHEQSRGDRDEFVEILWENIDEKYRDQFAIAPESFVELTRSFPFDYHSIMLYQTNAFVLRPDLPNMRSKGTEGGHPIDPVQDGLSEGDIRRLNRIFRGFE